MAGHPDAQVRKCGDQVDAESEDISPWTEMLQTQELTSLCTCGDVPFTQMERFHILEDCLTSGEKSLVYSSVPVCKYLMVLL